MILKHFLSVFSLFRKVEVAFTDFFFFFTYKIIRVLEECHATYVETVPFKTIVVFFTLPNCLRACLFWYHLGSNRWGSIPIDDHASGSCEAMHSAQLFQTTERSIPSRFRCCRVRRSTCLTALTIQPSDCKCSILEPTSAFQFSFSYLLGVVSW